jgi:hypothetical protein
MSDDHENSSWIMSIDREGIICDVSLGHYEVYVVSPQLKGGLGIALTDTGSQFSLVKRSSLTRLCAKRDKDFKICGVTGKEMNVRGQVEVIIENTLEPVKQLCYVVDSLPRKLDMILGQDWLEKEGYNFQKNTPIIIHPYSEKVVKCKTQEKGVRFIEHQVTQPGLICATSLVNCESY